MPGDTAEKSMVELQKWMREIREEAWWEVKRHDGLDQAIPPHCRYAR